jgi:hypothetical protein
MYIPLLLPTPYTVSIIHPDLIYGDVFIDPTDLGKNIKATYISNLGEISLEYCIKTILEENKNTTFHTIQYSKKQRKICFYTNNDLNTEKWQEKEIQPQKPLNTKEEVFETVLNVFDNELIYNQDCASLYEILMIYRNLEKKIKQTHKNISNIIENKLKTYIDKDLYCCVHNFEYDRHILPIHCSTYYSSIWDKYHYQKMENNSIKETKIEGFHDYNILGTVNDEIKELIDFYLSIKETKTQKKDKIKAINSNLLIDIDKYSIEVYTYENIPYYYLKDPAYKSIFYTYDKNSKHNCVNSNVIEKLSNNEVEFLRKIYIKIDDCPLWIREQLYNKRLHEIIERKKQEQLENQPIQKKLSLFTKKQK